jgi:ribosomal protein L32
MTGISRQNPMNRLPDWRVTMPMAHACARCGARTRAETSCRSPAMRNGRCRMHGGLSTGPTSPEGLARIVAARTVHGGYGAEARQFRELVREMHEDARRLWAEKF